MADHYVMNGRCYCKLCPYWWTEFVGWGPPARFNTSDGTPIALLKFRHIGRWRSDSLPVARLIKG